MVTLAREFDACGEVRLEIGGPDKYRVLTTEEAAECKNVVRDLRTLSKFSAHESE